jgi:hypothetical protein
VASAVLYGEHRAGDVLGLAEFSVQTLTNAEVHQDFVVFLIHRVVTILVPVSLFAAY